ncbi:MAG: hypothetical protein IKJ26_00520 [Clostridia bacterium]|nr:hypothetical protein [Clostridia bacterium]
MAFLNRDTGELTFSDGTRLSAGLPLEDELTQRLGGAQSGVIRLQSRSVQGGRLVPICTVEGGAVQSITLCVSSIGGKEPRTSARQRAFLFARMGLEDPCPDTQDCVRILCPFGEMLFVTDPHTLRPEVRLTFTAR